MQFWVQKGAMFNTKGNAIWLPFFLRLLILRPCCENRLRWRHNTRGGLEISSCLMASQNTTSTHLSLWTDTLLWDIDEPVQSFWRKRLMSRLWNNKPYYFTNQRLFTIVKNAVPRLCTRSHQKNWMLNTIPKPTNTGTNFTSLKIKNVTLKLLKDGANGVSTNWSNSPVVDVELLIMFCSWKFIVKSKGTVQLPISLHFNSHRKITTSGTFNIF